MERILEKEVMDDAENALAYSNADFSKIIEIFVDGFIENSPNNLENILDIGCGPCDVIIDLAKKSPKSKITGIDASKKMLELGEAKIKEKNLSNRIRLINGYIPGVDTKGETFTAIASKSFLHHLPNPNVFWKEVKSLCRDAWPCVSTSIYIMDLIRPKTIERVKELAEAEDFPQVLKDDFYNSLCAAFTIEEIEKQIKENDLDLQVKQIDEIHWLAMGTTS